MILVQSNRGEFSRRDVYGLLRCVEKKTKIQIRNRLFCFCRSRCGRIRYSGILQRTLPSEGSDETVRLNRTVILLISFNNPKAKRQIYWRRSFCRGGFPTPVLRLDRKLSKHRRYTLSYTIRISRLSTVFRIIFTALCQKPYGSSLTNGTVNQ